MQEKVDGEPCCLICDGRSVHHISVPNWGEMRRCLSCGFVFANPMTLPERPETLFGRAYAGQEIENIRDFQNLLLYREVFNASEQKPQSFFFNSAIKQAIHWLKENVAPDSVVFEIGCGSGFFLEAIGRLGYRPVGLEVAEAPVKVLQKDGYQVWHGTIDTVPPGWVDPEVCASFFVTHHLSAPMGFFKTIRAKFPQAILLIAARNRLGRGIHFQALPPRNLSWWGEKPLRLAMEKAGYEVEIIPLKAVPTDFLFPYIVHFLLHFRRRKFFPYLFTLYSWSQQLISWPLAFFYRLRGWNNSVLAIGRPR